VGQDGRQGAFKHAGALCSLYSIKSLTAPHGSVHKARRAGRRCRRDAAVPARAGAAQGIEIVRRDNCALVRNVITTCLEMILIARDEEGAKAYVRATIADLLMNRLDLSLLVITKARARAAWQTGMRHLYRGLTAAALHTAAVARALHQPAWAHHALWGGYREGAFACMGGSCMRTRGASWRCSGPQMGPRGRADAVLLPARPRPERLRAGARPGPDAGGRLVRQQGRARGAGQEDDEARRGDRAHHGRPRRIRHRQGAQPPGRREGTGCGRAHHGMAFRCAGAVMRGNVTFAAHLHVPLHEPQGPRGGQHAVRVRMAAALLRQSARRVGCRAGRAAARKRGDLRAARRGARRAPRAPRALRRRRTRSTRWSTACPSTASTTWTTSWRSR